MSLLLLVLLIVPLADEPLPVAATVSGIGGAPNPAVVDAPVAHPVAGAPVESFSGIAKRSREMLESCGRRGESALTKAVASQG